MTPWHPCAVCGLPVDKERERHDECDEVAREAAAILMQMTPYERKAILAAWKMAAADLKRGRGKG